MSGSVMNNTSRTDWTKVDALTDEQIDTSDIPALSEEFFARAQWRILEQPLTVTVPIDPETLAWFQERGEAAAEEMAAALRIYAEAHKAHATSKRRTA